MVAFAEGGVALELARLLLLLLRLGLFAVVLALTLVSFQAYYQNRSKRLESAFIGFAFLSMGVAMSTLNSQTTIANESGTFAFYSFQIAEVTPFVVGFALLFVSLYR